MFIREDFTLFRNLGTLTQTAGVSLSRLRRLAVKELVDNALDAGANVEFGKQGENIYWVQDDGSGIQGGGKRIASLFSVARPLTSSKVLRLPLRGALGNGLRVVVGTALASGGSLTVETLGRWYDLQPLDDGTTIISSEGDSAVSGGTKISLRVGPGLAKDEDDLLWAKQAKVFRFGSRYEGKTSAWWYDSDSFYELLLSAGHLALNQLLEEFDGFGDKGTSSFNFIGGLGLPNTSVELTREQADSLLEAMRKVKPAPKAKALGAVGKLFGEGYAKQEGSILVKPGRGSLSADLPCVVEVWAIALDDGQDDWLVCYVNGTPITGEMRTARQKGNKLAAFGCGLKHYVSAGRRSVGLRVNVITPYMPITTDGKEPDFSRYLDPMQKAISRATGKLKSNLRRALGVSSQQEVVLNNLHDAIAQASGDGRYRYSLRQLFYAVRPHVLESGLENTELDYNHFSKIIGKYESESGDLPGLYRDPRGTLYHPHERRGIPVGTLAIEEYRRPEWTFNKVLYCEKEGFLNMLIADGWPERNDCALLSSKGFASRAVRDLLDLLGDTGEEIQFFCVHDADASGTLIYQALTESTEARAARRVKVINFGLEPWEALEMGLQVENFTVKGGRTLPVAQYVKDRRGRDWARWLQGRRVELNAMTSPQFLEWLDGKLEEHGIGKVVPPEDILQNRLESFTESAVRDLVREQLLREGDFEQKVSERLSQLRPRLSPDNLGDRVRQGLEVSPATTWETPLREEALTLVKEQVLKNR